MQRRLLQRVKSVMPQPPQITVKERAQIRYPVFQHRNPVNAHTKGKTIKQTGHHPEFFRQQRVYMVLALLLKSR